MLNDSPLTTRHSPLDSPLDAKPLADSNSPLRILTVADFPPNPDSGAAGTVFATNVALRGLGHEVDEIWSDQLGPRKIAHGNLHSLVEQPQACRREVIKATANKKYDVIMISQPQGYLAAKALRKDGFKGILVNRSHGLELRVDESVPKWHRNLSIPESKFPRSLLTPILRKLLQRQWSCAMKYFDGVVVPCEMDCGFLKARFPGYQNIRTIHHGVSRAILDASPSELSVSERQESILHVGQFAFYKGPHLVARIMNRVLEANTRVRMTWVTSSSGCQDAAQLIDPKFLQRVSLVPWTTQSALVKIYDSHGIFLFPSLCEGAGKSSLEAMARGMCVIASDDSGMRDYIMSGINGILCPVGDTEAFANAILRTVAHASLDHMSLAATNYARQKTWDACATSLLTFFYSLLAMRKVSNVEPG